jgi:hypothetical protein
MPQVPQQHDAAQKDPAQLLTKLFKDFTGVNTAASRLAIPDDKVYNCENVIPIGSQNYHVVKNISGVLAGYGSDTVYWSQGVNLNNTEYLVNFSNTGKVFFYNVATKTSNQVNSGSPLSGANSRCCQWQNNIILFIDATGYYSYDGTTFSQVLGSGVPSFGDDIQVYAGRVWIVQGRLLILSGAGDYSAASFLPANGAAFTALVDPQIRTKVSRMTVANGYLYLFAATSVNIISNVQVPFGSVPPSPIFLNTNIQTLIGTDQPASIFAFDIFTMFANKYGVYKLYGLNAPKVSDDIDGTWQYLDFTQAISGGQVVVDNILCTAFLIKRLNDPQFGSNTVLALWFQKDNKDHWWFANYGALTFIVPTFVSGVATLYGFIGNQLFELFSDATTAPEAIIMTKLWPMEDDLATKEVFRVGFMAELNLLGSQIQLFVDTPTVSIDSGVAINVFSGPWVNSAGATGDWINTQGQVGGWFSPGPYLTSGAPPGGMFDRYIGLTLKTTGFNYELNMMALDYKLRDRWV